MQLEVHVSARSSWGHWSIFFTHLQMTMGSRCMNRQNNLIFNNLSDSNGSLLVHASWIQTELRIGTHRLARIQSGTRATTISKGRDQTIQWMNPSWNRFCSLLTLIQLQREDVRITVGPWIKTCICAWTTPELRSAMLLFDTCKRCHKKHVQLSYLVPGHTKFEPDRLLVELQENFELEMCSPSRV